MPQGHVGRRQTHARKKNPDPGPGVAGLTRESKIALFKVEDGGGGGHNKRSPGAARAAARPAPAPTPGRSAPQAPVTLETLIH